MLIGLHQRLDVHIDAYLWDDEKNILPETI